MTPRPTPRQTADCIHEIQQIAKRLRLLEPAVRNWASVTGPDGYATRSGPGDNYGGRGGHGDPVGALVTRRLDHPRSDVFAAAHTDMVAKIQEARRLLEQAEAAFASVSPGPVVANRTGP